MTTPQVKKSTIAINWIEKMLIAPDGAKVGSPIKLLDFQKRFLRDVYDCPHPDGCRLAIWSAARKNSKTLLVACIFALHCIGPFAHPNSQLYSMAMTRDQASETFRYMLAMLRLNPAFDGHYKARESTKFIKFPRIGTTFQALSADKDGAKTQGKSPIVFVFDEAGQTVGPTNPLFDAMFTGQSAHKNPMAFLISTQSAQASDLLSIAIADALEGNDPRTVCHLYTTDPATDPWSVEALKQANPAWDAPFFNQKDKIFQQERAQRMASYENDFKNKHLNMMIEKNEAFIAKPIWDENAKKPEDYRGKKVYIGLDLSSTRDLTACSIIHLNEDGESYSVNMKYWLPEFGIAEKERLDKIPYQAQVKKGLLSLTPGKSVDYDFVSSEIAKLNEECDIQVVSFDRWNLKHFTKSMVSSGISEKWIEDTFKPFGQGFQSMSPAIRQIESLLLNGKFHHGGTNELLTWNFRNIKIIRDPAGNRKFDKLGYTRRIDGAVACVMAIAPAIEGSEKRKFTPYYADEDIMFL